MKKTTIITISALALAVAATASVIIHKAIPRPQELASERVMLNQVLHNDSSSFDELQGLDRKVRAYMRKWAIKGASLAISRNDSLLYAKGYGWADEELGIEMQPSHIMRMASVSKLITAAGIMVLQDRDSLNIKDTVFGPSGILKDSPFAGVIKDRNYSKITVEHLLRHQGGFSRDPLFSSRDVKHQLQLDCPPDKDDFFRLVLSRNLRFMPGSWQKYSNFGYLLLYHEVYLRFLNLKHHSRR